MLIWLGGNPRTAGVDHGIVRAAELETVIAAQALRDNVDARCREALAQAESQADQIVRDARRRADELMEQASSQIEASIRRGYDDGKRLAVLDWHEEQARKNTGKARALRTMHETLAEIVTTAVERIVYTESRSALYQRALKNVQLLTRGATSLTLRVSSEDSEHAHATLAAVATASMTSMPIEVMVDPSLRQGSCIFESDVGVLDASLETQLDGLRMAMERAVRKLSAVDGEQAASASADELHDDDTGADAFDNDLQAPLP